MMAPADLVVFVDDHHTYETIVIANVVRLFLIGTLFLLVCLQLKDYLPVFFSSFDFLLPVVSSTSPVSGSSSDGNVSTPAGSLSSSSSSEAAGDESSLPGPYGLPFVGYMPFLGNAPHKTLARLVDRYGSMFRVKAGSRQFVVFSSVAKILEMAKRYPEELYGKPRTFTTEKLSIGAHNDILARWKKRRAYTNAGLKYLERYSITDIIQGEVRNMLEFLETISGEGTARDVRHDVSYFVSCVLYRVAYGGGLPDTSAQDGLKKMVHTMPSYTTTIGSFSPFDLIPLLRYVLKNKFEKFVDFNQFMNRFCRQEKLKALRRETETETRKNADDNEDGETNAPPSDLFHFFKRKWERMSESERSKFSLTDDILYDGLEDIIRAGTESSSLIIQWFLLYMVAFPDDQKKMQAELDAYMSTRGDLDSLPVLDDVDNLPYCHAVLLETYRYCCLNPFLKRELTADITVDGVRLRRGTVLLFNNWAINNDPENWSDPELFQPERFLRRDGTLDAKKAELFIPFGFGKRRCIGVQTGRSVCLLSAVSVVHRFELELDEGSEKPDLEAVFGIGLSPKEYKLLFRRRS